MTNTKVNLSRRKDGRTEIVRAVSLSAKDLYIRAIVAKSTTEAATELGALRVFQLALYLATRIG
jgi:hypothetical protein